MPPPTTVAITCFQLIALLRTVPGISASKRCELASAARRFCRICGLDPSEVIVDPQVIRRLAERANWQLAGLTKQSWANLLSRLTCAMKIAGIKVHRRRRNHKLDQSWESLLAPLARRDRDELHPFAGWCSTHVIEPDQVDQDVFERYLEYLVMQTIQRDPRERWHVARRAWNRTVAALPVSPYSVIQNVEPEGWRGLRWDSFPPSLLAEIEAYKVAAVEFDPFEESKNKAIKEITVRNYLNNLRWYLSFLVQAGVPIERFASLSACLSLELVKRLARLKLRGQPMHDKARPGLHAMMTAILNIARHVGTPDADLQKLRQLLKKVRHSPVGMSERNDERLAQFVNPSAHRALINLPFVVARRLAKVEHPTIRDAQEMQIAALLGILLFLPIRIKNAATLDLDRHIRRPAGPTGPWLVHFDKDEVKNDKEIDCCLNEHLSALLARYVEVFRPVLLKSPTSKLFVGQTGTEKGPRALGRQFSAFLKRELGLKVNPHLMRHLAAFAVLRAYPGQYERVRQLLGHKSIQTTITFYSKRDKDASFKCYDGIISASIDASLLSSIGRRGASQNFEAL